MHDNSAKNDQAWHECGQDDGQRKIHAREIESESVTLVRPQQKRKETVSCRIAAMGFQHTKHEKKFSMF
jgi:hypothetical protein